MISELVQNIGEAGSIRINQMVYDKKRQGIDVTVLSLGEAFFEIPYLGFESIDFTKGYHYSDTRGLPGLRKKISDYYRSRYGVASDPNKHILISAGSKIILYMVTLASINPGDEVLIQEPFWVSYPEQIKLCRGEPKVIPYWVKGKDFKSYFTPKTKLVIINNPNNPAGSLYSKSDIEYLYELCRSSGARFVVDEAYSDFCLDDGFYSAGKLSPEFKDVVVVNSLSKNMGMSGWRIGYMLSDEKFNYEVLKLNQHLITCASTVLLQYCEQYFEQILGATLPQVAQVVEKRNRIAKYMDSIQLKRLEGSSTFYFFVDIKASGKNSTQFAEWILKEHNIAVVPGIAYGPNTDGFVRVSVGTETEERIRNALDVIRKACS